MFRVRPEELARFRTPGGDEFTEFVDAVIRAQAFVLGMPSSSIHTNCRTDIPDGGVDTMVGGSSPNDPTGWLRSRTIWQYKAITARTVRKPALKNEVLKQFVREHIEAGYAYRLCICDSLSWKKQKELTETIASVVKQLNPDAPEPAVLSNDDLAKWVEGFPEVVMDYLRPGVSRLVQSYQSWRESIVGLMPHYIGVPEWQDIKEAIAHHLDFSAAPPKVCFTLQGEPGVGKTRLVYESITENPGLAQIVVYSDGDRDQSVIQFARELANDAKAVAVLVADDCSASTRGRLQAILEGCKDRIRVIAIDNSLEEPPAGHVEYRLEKASDEVIDKVLECNFPGVPSVRRRAYTNLGGGYLRLAADLCQHDSEIAQNGQVEPALDDIRNHLHRHLTEEDQLALEALSMVSKVGFKDDVAGQLGLLGGMVGIDRETLFGLAVKLRNGPGYVARLGRFYAVTPEIIANVSFENSWRRWAEPDPERFLDAIPIELLRSFLTRLKCTSSLEVRSLVGEHFLSLAGELTPEHLSNPVLADLLATLIEVDPRIYLPILRRLVESASESELVAIGKSTSRTVGPRRRFVWLMEGFVAFPEFFHSAEAILLRLALAENEPQITNSATGIWKQIFRVLLSGTATPFLDRLQLLEDHILMGGDEESDLALDVLETVFNRPFSRMLGSPVVGGRIPPDEWHPEGIENRRLCTRGLVSLLCRLVESKDQRIRDRACWIVVHNVGAILGSQRLQDLKHILDVADMTDEMVAGIIKAADGFVFSTRESKVQVTPEQAGHIAEIQKWIEGLRPSDFHGRLVTAFSLSYWDNVGGNGKDPWEAEVDKLANHALNNPEELRQEMAWLCSPQAKGAVAFGLELGRRDLSLVLLDVVLEASEKHTAAALASGYLQSLVDRVPESLARINMALDRIEQQSPGLAFELSLAGGDATGAFERCLRLVDAAVIPVAYLRAFLVGVRSRPLEPAEFEDALERLRSAIREGDKVVYDIAVEFVAYHVAGDDGPSDVYLGSERARRLVWQVMESATSDCGGSTYWWGETIRRLFPLDTDRAAMIAAAGLVGKSFDLEKHAEELLAEMAPRYPREVMKHVGKVALDEATGWRFFLSVYRSLIGAIPENTISEWLENEGVEAARHLARHLPTPYLDSAGNAVVPSVTEYVLERFEPDERVYKEFCLGVGSFEPMFGDISGKREHDAETAKKFLGHRLRRIRQWAAREVSEARQDAEWWRREDEEMGLP